METFVWHPNEDGLYWYNQGMAHINGTGGKTKSIPDAVRCFKNGILSGDNACAHNFAFLYCKGLTECDEYEIYAILKDLMKKGLIKKTDTEFVINEVNLLEKLNLEDETDRYLLDAVKIRIQVEKNLEEVASRRGMSFKSKETGKKVQEAYDSNLIDYTTRNTYWDICKYVGGIIHVPPSVKPASEEQMRKWKDFIESR